MNTRASPTTAKIDVIQIGDRTHHQDHVIIFRSFKVMNTIVRSPTNPIPPDDVFELFSILL